MKLFALFNHDPGDNIVNELGYNLNQRLYYQPDVILLPVNSGPGYLRTLLEAAKSGEVTAIVSERSFHSIFACLFRLLFSNVYWIYDTPDCPLKESEELFKRGTFRWLRSYLKGRLVYHLIRHADLRIINYSAARFFKHYRGHRERLYFFRNALPDLPPHHHPEFRNSPDPLKLLYIGSSLPSYGVETLIDGIRQFNQTQASSVTLDIYGHDAPAEHDSFIRYHGRQPRASVLQAIHDADVCVCPFHSGTDIEMTYPIKNMEYFCYGRKLLLTSTPGMQEQFDGIDTKDIYYAEPGSAVDIARQLQTIISDLASGRYDAERATEPFSAEIKNQRIAELYHNVAKQK